ncbi:MAG: DUF488 family protein [Chthoniobacterales bacterium]
MSNTIWTVGHSTRTLEDFVETLKAYDIELLVDVRRFPGSRRLPQFGSEELRAAVESNGIAYLWIESLGGRRPAHRDSRNLGWTNSAFRGYADHAETEEFAAGLFELLNVAAGLRTAIMCAEVLWWRCHRRIVSDVLVSLGDDVIHVRDAKVSERHRLSAPGRIIDGVLSYSPD